jgi:hypothetical protein
MTATDRGAIKDCVYGNGPRAHAGMIRLMFLRLLMLTLCLAAVSPTVGFAQTSENGPLKDGLYMFVNKSDCPDREWCGASLGQPRVGHLPELQRDGNYWYIRRNPQTGLYSINHQKACGPGTIARTCNVVLSTRPDNAPIVISWISGQEWRITPDRQKDQYTIRYAADCKTSKRNCNKYLAYNPTRASAGADLREKPFVWKLINLDDLVGNDFGRGQITLDIKTDKTIAPNFDQIYVQYRDYGSWQNQPRAYYHSFFDDSERTEELDVQVRHCDHRPLYARVVRNTDKLRSSPDGLRQVPPETIANIVVFPEKGTHEFEVGGIGGYKIDVAFTAPEQARFVRCDGVGPYHWLRILAAATMAMLPALLWWLVKRYRRSPETHQRVVGWARFFLNREYAGKGTIQQLDRRWKLLLVDLFYLATTATLAVRAEWARRDPDFNLLWQQSELVEKTLGLGYFIAVLLFLVSILLRLFAKRRFRPTPVLLVSLFLTVCAFVYSSAARSMLDHDAANVAELLLLILFPILGVILLVGFRRRTITFNQLRIGSYFLFGALIADVLFKIVLGSYASDRFDVWLNIGDTAALFVIAASAFVFYRYLEERGSFAVWPVCAIVSAIILRLLVTAQGTLSDVTDGGVSAGLGEIFLAAIFGALAAEGAMLAKRVWIDRDPQARRDAVRVRGALLIFHGISPVLIILLVVFSLNAFTTQASRELSEAGKGIAQLESVAERATNEAMGAAGRLLDQQDNVLASVESFRTDLLNVQGPAILDKFDKLMESSLAAAGRTATAAAGEAKRQATKIIDDTKEAIGDAISLPPIDVGLFEIPFPDLGIGDALGGVFDSMFSNVFADIDFNQMLETFVSMVTNSIAQEFTGPMQEAQAILTAMEGIKNEVEDEIGSQAQELTDNLTTLTSNLSTGMDDAFEAANTIIVRLINIAYQLLILTAMLVLAALLYLLWNAVNGLVVMMGRVERGWTMIATGKEDDLDNEADASPEPAKNG